MASSYGSLLAELAKQGGTVIISRRGGSVSISHGCVTVGSSIGISSDGKSVSLNNQWYSLDDPHAVRYMDPDTRRSFWAMCSDKGKDSDLYRAYAGEILSRIGVRPDAIADPAMRQAFFNHAKGIAEIGEACKKAGHVSWERDLAGLSVEKLKLLAAKASDFKHLVELRSYGLPFAALINIKEEYLSVILSRGYNSSNLLKALHKMRYPDLLSTFTSIPIDALETILSNQYNATCLMEHLYSQRYLNPFVTLASIEKKKLTQLFSEQYNATTLMKHFAKYGMDNPLKALLDLDEATWLLFCSERHHATQIMDALYSLRIPNPLVYLQNLGLQAMIVMFNNAYEYTARIKRGVDLQLEFAPAKPASSSRAQDVAAQLAHCEKYQNIMNFASDIRRKGATNTIRLAGLTISEDDREDFKDSFTGNIADIPVRVDGDLFDMKTLEQLPEDSAGMRKHPITGHLFVITDIQPAKDVQRRIEALIVRAEREEARASTSMSFS